MEPKLTGQEDSLSALIIDDESDICFLLSKILKNNNLDVRFVNSLNDGKISLQERKPNLLFLDNYLPDGYGVDFIRYVKNEYAGVKIIMVTAHDTMDDRKKAIAEGVDVFMAKPFSASEVKNAIKAVYQ